MATQLDLLQGERDRIREFENIQRATLNILEDFDGEKRTLEQVRSAALNLLDDFDTEKKRLEQVQSATLNLLEDFDAEKKRLESVQRAAINILEDFDSEKHRSEQSQRAVLNILEDMDAEKGKVADANRQLESVNRELEKEVAARARAEVEIRQLNNELEQRVTQRTAELEVANRELEAFTYSVAHDLRAPLRHVDGFSKLLQEEHNQELSADAQDYVSTIRESVLQMGELIDDLLNLARIGRKELNVQVTGLGSLVQRVVDDLRQANPNRDIEWRIQALPFVECDPALIKQVFVNLLSNAVKFTRPRSPAVIEVGACRQDDHTLIYVKDNGVGFSMKYVDKLFGVFQRLHRAEDFEGTGVGLATVQRIVQKHGGRISAQGELDRGATFRFSIGAADKGSNSALSAGGKA